MAKIKNALEEFNPWWKEGFQINFKEREVYKNMQKFIGMPQIIALTGLRRVGKTTLMLKLVQDAIIKHFQPLNIIYFSFDEFKEIEIRDIIKEYEFVVEKNFKKEKYLLLLDEIQKLKNWEEQLKVIYDIFKNVKIIISGSESLFIRKKSREALVGRLFEFQVDPLSFREFLVFKNIDLRPVALYQRELSRLFREFILTQGFPELVCSKEKEVIRKYVMESIVEKVIYRDIPGLFKIKDIGILKSLFELLMEEPGQLIELSTLSKDLKISRQTLSNYLFYLEKSFLIRKLYNFSRSRRKVERKLRKYYSTIISVDVLFRDDQLSKSRAFEWLIVNQLKAEFFWRDPYKNEVDVVMIRKTPLPIEIKYGKIEVKGLLAFMKKFKVKKGYILSENEQTEKKYKGYFINVIPAFKFLMEINEFI